MSVDAKQAIKELEAMQRRVAEAQQALARCEGNIDSFEQQLKTRYKITAKQLDKLITDKEMELEEASRNTVKMFIELKGRYTWES